MGFLTLVCRVPVGSVYVCCRSVNILLFGKCSYSVPSSGNVTSSQVKPSKTE